MADAGPDAIDVDDLLAANARYAETFSLGALEARAARGLAVVTCFDSRIEPLQMLGLVAGDAKIMRTAGGRVTDDVLSSLELAVERLGVVRVVVIPHTECAAPGVGIDALREDVRRVREHPVLGTAVDVAGLRYDVRTGLLEQLA